MTIWEIVASVLGLLISAVFAYCAFAINNGERDGRYQLDDRPKTLDGDVLPTKRIH